jgi:hypothetical protein
LYFIQRIASILSLIISSLLYFGLYSFVNIYQKKKRVTLNENELIVNYKPTNMVFDINNTDSSKSLLDSDSGFDGED